MRRRPKLNRRIGAPRPDRWPWRALIAVIAVIGVVAMHGLTMNHDSAMAAVSTGSPLPPAGAEPLGAMTSAGDALSAMTQMAVMTRSVAALEAKAVTRVGMEVPADPMTTACLAFLAGLLLLVGAGRLVRRVRPEATTRPNTHHASWFATALDRLRPDLGELSVLRT